MGERHKESQKEVMSIPAFWAHNVKGRRAFIGARGDFITAPEVSGVFGQFIAAWILTAWRHAGAPKKWVLAELGCGRGTLLKDMLPVLKKHMPTYYDMQLHVIEQNDDMWCECQKNVNEKIIRHLRPQDLPEDMPLFIIANEFFDALPIRQFIKKKQGYEECYLEGFVCKTKSLSLHAQKRLSPFFRQADEQKIQEGQILEYAPLALHYARICARKLMRQGGVMLIMDYGYECGFGDTIQAVASHRFCAPFSCAVWRGGADLSAHVNFSHLRDVFAREGCQMTPLVTQSDFLHGLGIKARFEQLRELEPQREGEWVRAYMRLCGRREMGALFKVMAVAQNEKTLSHLEGFKT